MKSFDHPERRFASGDAEGDPVAGYYVPNAHYALHQPQLKCVSSHAQRPYHHEGSDQICSRYCDQPIDWRSRLFGIGGTAVVASLVLAFAFFTWRIVQPMVVSSSAPLVMELRPLAAPPEPVREVAPGPQQVEKQQAKPEPKREILPPPLVPLASVPSPKTTAQEPVEIVDPGPPVLETSAPQSIAAPVAGRCLAR